MALYLLGGRGEALVAGPLKKNFFTVHIGAVERLLVEEQGCGSGFGQIRVFFEDRIRTRLSSLEGRIRIWVKSTWIRHPTFIHPDNVSIIYLLLYQKE